LINDGDLFEDFVDTESDCFMSFEVAREGYYYDISEARFYINDITENMPHV
jgi:hypothetical protein